MVLYSQKNENEKNKLLKSSNKEEKERQPPDCTVYPQDTGNDDNPDKLKTISEHIFEDLGSEEQATFNAKVGPYLNDRTEGGVYKSFQLNGDEMNILIISLHNTVSNSATDDHVLTLCALVPNPEVELRRPAIFWWSIFVAVSSFVSVMLLVWFCIFQTTHGLIRPLRHLNDRMIEIMEEGNDDGAEINIGESCKEIARVEKIFKQLIQDRQFSNNDFLHKEEALAIIDLANICSTFENSNPPNHRFAGICYNNIANLQYKSGMFSVASENWIRAIEKAQICAQESHKKAKKTKDLDDPVQSYLVSETFQEFKKLHAHRYYQLAICQFKKIRYGQENQKSRDNKILDFDRETLRQEWEDIDSTLQRSITLYCDLRYQRSNGAWQPIFIDLIIRLLIARAFAINSNNRPLSAHRILDRAEKMLKMVRSGKLEVMTDPQVRAQAFLFPYDILTQKYLMHRGLIHVSQEYYPEALLNFETCLQSGGMYDPRIEKECLQQIQAILAKQYKAQDQKLNQLLFKYQSMERDFIFLIDETVSLERRSIRQMTSVILQIFDQHIQPRDRVCLVKYGKERYAKKVFSLVLKENNITQLRNQLVQIKEDFKAQTATSSMKQDHKIFAKSIKTVLSEFKSGSSNKKWLIIFSKQIPSITEEYGINYNMQAAAKLGKSNANLLFVLFQVPNKIVETANFAQFQDVMVSHQSREQRRKSGKTECLLLIEPSERQVDAQMDLIENLRLEYNHPMIYETFK